VAAGSPGSSSGSASWLSIVGGGVVGALLAFLLTWYREHRRSAEAYRAPQRLAVADIVATTNELVTRGALAAEAIFAELVDGGLVRSSGLGTIDTNRIGPPMNDVRRAASDLVGALDLGRIVVVEPECRKALDAANEAMSPVKRFLGQPNPETFVHLPFYKDHLAGIILNLEARVDHLVDASEYRLGPVVSLGTRLQHVVHRIDAAAGRAAVRLAEADRG
jgi:hypothetical protein